jgi:predicted short-subunit dehydrogenase-like oxidoreductase (DUF2520 family)
MHPNFPFPTRRRVANLHDVCFGIEGDSAAIDAARHLCSLIGATPVELTRAAKPAYHASASIASNFAVTLFDLACRLRTAAGMAPELAARSLLPLLRGTVENVAESGSPAALTGPIERGDVEVVRAHLDSLARLAPDLLPVYTALAYETIRVAIAKGSLQDAQAARLRSILGEARGRP